MNLWDFADAHPYVFCFLVLCVVEISTIGSKMLYHSVRKVVRTRS